MFARHLLLQGYKTDQITILTTYSGQLFHFRSVSLPNQLLNLHDLNKYYGLLK